MMKFLSATLSAMVVVASGFVASAQAEVSVQGIADNLAANGFTNVEVKVGATQVKAEGVNNGSKIEVTYDRVTGKIMNQEMSQVRATKRMQVSETTQTMADDDMEGHDGSDDDHGMGASQGSGSDHSDDGADHESDSHSDGGSSHDGGSDSGDSGDNSSDH
jgi:hypothetical protein